MGLLNKYLKGDVKAEKVSYGAGSVIFSEKDMPRAMYFIEFGQVKIVKKVPESGREVSIDAFGPNEFFGELSLLTDKPRTADAVASTNCVVWVMDEKSFRKAAAEDHEFSLLIMKGLANKLAHRNEKIRELFAVMKEATGRLEELYVLWHALLP